jgi:uncharacterized protein (DUF3820 family)
MPQLTDTSPMPWGAHKGTPMEDVPARYLLWLHETKKYTPEVREYILDNMDVLKHELKTK